MNQQNRALLAITSRLLSYPEGDFLEEYEAIRQCATKHIASSAIRKQVENAALPLSRLSMQALQELYVHTFDLKSKLGLYLSAHELGDSNKRGAALIKMQKLVNEAGYERVDGELADYIPMLLEFLAVSEENAHHERLQKRLGVVVQRMVNHMPDDNPYRATLYLLMDHVFPTPTEEAIDKLEFEREEADLEELPFPIMYS